MTRIDENPYADGDIIKVSDLLTAAGANLDAPSIAPGANGTMAAKHIDLRVSSLSL